MSNAAHWNPADANKRDQQNYDRPGKHAHIAGRRIADPQRQHLRSPQTVQGLGGHQDDPKADGSPSVSAIFAIHDPAPAPLLLLEADPRRTDVTPVCDPRHDEGGKSLRSSVAVSEIGSSSGTHTK